MGDDGHTQSLFPHAGVLDVAARWVVDSPPGILPPPVDRMTITLPVLNAARHALFIVGGGKKAEAVRDVLEGGGDFHDRPSAGVQPKNGRLTFLLDQDAAKLLKNR